VIKIEGLSKYYGNRLAVDDISFSVEKGEIVGFLGPNGAGKTTTMRIITGYLMPSEGQVWIGDYNMAAQSLQGRRLIGYLPELVPLYTDMTTRAYLEFTARLRGLEKQRTRRRVEEVVAQCALEEYVDVLLGKLSKGFKQRVGLAQAIIHDPEVLVLDEPTIGIDPIQVAQTRQLIRTLGQDRTILLSTHILPEVSMICERVIIIHEGKIVAQDRIENLSMLIKGGKRLRLKVKGPVDEVTDSLGGISAVREVHYEQPNHIVEFASDQEPQAEITEMLVRRGWTLLAMESAEMSLEDIFLQLTGEEEAEG
jgi:ABC-2 type transport system ATP-binding protein